jgi:hypothetical protein
MSDTQEPKPQKINRLDPAWAHIASLEGNGLRLLANLTSVSTATLKVIACGTSGLSRHSINARVAPHVPSDEVPE